MNILWKNGQGTVGDVVAALPRRPPIAYNTVQTLLRILEEKGYVSHEQVGRRFVYRPVIEQHVARRRALGHLLKSLFDDSPSLLLNALGDEGLERSEVERLKKLIGDA